MLLQLVLITYAVIWMCIYYKQTLVSNLNYYSLYSVLGQIGRFSLFVSLILMIIAITLLIWHKKKSVIFSINILYLVYFLSILFFISDMARQIFFSYGNLSIILKTFLWVNFSLILFVNSICLIIALSCLIYFLFFVKSDVISRGGNILSNS